MKTWDEAIRDLTVIFEKKYNVYLEWIRDVDEVIFESDKKDQEELMEFVVLNYDDKNIPKDYKGEDAESVLGENEAIGFCELILSHKEIYFEEVAFWIRPTTSALDVAKDISEAMSPPVWKTGRLAFLAFAFASDLRIRAWRNELKR